MTKMPYLEEIFGLSWKDPDLKKTKKTWWDDLKRLDSRQLEVF